MGGGLSSEGRRVAVDCSHSGLSESCLDNINRLERSSDKERIHETFCGSGQLATWYDTEGCEKMCTENRDLRDKCRERLTERCNNIPGNLQDNIRYYPECLSATQEGTIGTLEDTSTVSSMGKSAKGAKGAKGGKAMSMWTIIGVIVAIIIVIMVFMAFSDSKKHHTAPVNTYTAPSPVRSWI